MAKLLDKRAPGRRFLKRLSLRTKYWLVGGLSAVLVGSGLSVLNEASHLKHDGQPLMQWFIMGVYGFILTIGGLGLMQISTRFRVLMDIRRELRRERKKARRGPRRQFPRKENPVGGA